MMNKRIKYEIMAIRKTALTNMFDIKTVQKIAYEMAFYDLVIFLEDNKEKYINFILYGDEK